MRKSLFICAVTLLVSAYAVAQQSNPYEGVSHPPSDDTIIATPEVEAKPPAGHPYTAAQPVIAPASKAQTAATTAALPVPVQEQGQKNFYAHQGTDAGIVQVASQSQNQPYGTVQPALTQRTPSYANDPDGGIVHPPALPPGQIASGTVIRVKLLTDLSSGFNKVGDPFRARVASDVLADGNVVIPAGSVIQGRVSDASTGHFAGSGSLMLQPDWVTLPDGSSYRLHAVVASTPGSRNRVQAEGQIIPDPGIKRAGIEYGGAIGAGAITGAYIGGPVGALVGGLVGAGAVTTHLLVSHPQVHLDNGTYMTLTLTHNMQLQGMNQMGN
ncbi:MAG: hypothetical protein KGN79_00545 [Acidobacteriota bacterium]|nr:hypothetical protein [Acidobacteriota bacterium]